MIGRPRARGPVKLALLRCAAHIVDARFPTSHEPLFIELPLFIAVRPTPLAGVVVAFVLKGHRNALVMKCPQLLDQAVVKLLGPLCA